MKGFILKLLFTEGERRLIFDALDSQIKSLKSNYSNLGGDLEVIKELNRKILSLSKIIVTVGKFI